MIVDTQLCLLSVIVEPHESWPQVIGGSWKLYLTWWWGARNLYLRWLWVPRKLNLNDWGGLGKAILGDCRGTGKSTLADCKGSGNHLLGDCGGPENRWFLWGQGILHLVIVGSKETLPRWLLGQEIELSLLWRPRKLVLFNYKEPWNLPLGDWEALGHSILDNCRGHDSLL